MGAFLPKISHRCLPTICFLFEIGSSEKVFSQRKECNPMEIMTVLTHSMKKLHCEV